MWCEKLVKACVSEGHRTEPKHVLGLLSAGIKGVNQLYLICKSYSFQFLILKFLKIYLPYVYVLLYVCTYIMDVPGAQGGQNKALELQG